MSDFRVIVNLATRIIQDGQVCLNMALSKYGLSSSEANVLMFLYSSGDGIPQDTIVSGTAVSKAAISRTVDSLVRKGFLSRTRNSTDKRLYQVWLTEKARNLQDYIQDQYNQMVTAASRGVPQDKVEEFTSIFRQVAENLDAYREERFGGARAR